LIATDPAVAEGFFAPGSRSITADDHSQWVQRHDDWTLRRLVNFVVRDHDGGMPIGQLGIAGAEISFCIKRDRWGCGLATELVGGFCVNAGTMLGLSHLVARVSRGNIGSRVVLERCGFRFAGLVSGPAFAERRPDLFLRYVAAI
jgi:RimJ/RimL family protein N-acetyltransferase